MSRNTAAVRIRDKLKLTSNNPQWLDRRGEGAGASGGKMDNRVRVRRYWPGKAPAWAPEEDEDDKEMAEAAASDEEEETAVPSASAPVPEVQQKHDPRLARLAATRGAAADRSEALASRRAIHQAQVLDDSDEEEEEEEAAAEARQRAALLRRAQAEDSDEEEEEEDEDIIELRRMQMKRRMEERRAAAEAEAEEEMAVEDEEDEEDEEDSSEYETDSEEEGPGGRAMIKPMFVPKKERETIAEREKIEAELEQEHESKKARAEARKVETREIVDQEIRREVEMTRAMDGAVARHEDVDTDDEVNEEEEYEAWKARELKRIKRDRDMRETAFKEREELEMLRSMTEEERREWDRKNPKEAKVQDTKKWKFLQKYYHKGAFFQDAPDDQFGTQGTEEIYGRDYGDAVGEDVMDRSILPKVMQVRRGQFGRSGRSKWTHLVAEDTTNWDSPYANNDQLRVKYTGKMAGMNQSFEKPKAKDLLKKGTTI